VGSASASRAFKVQTAYGAIEIPADLYDPEVNNAYTEGQCVALALELHKRTGYPIVVILDEPYPPHMSSTRMAAAIASSLHHALVLTPEGNAIDINGSRPLHDYLESIDPGYSSEHYHGVDPDFLDGGEPHDPDCFCQAQCYPNGSFAALEVSASDLEYVIALGELPRPARRAATYFAGEILRSLKPSSKVKVAHRGAATGKEQEPHSRRT